MLEIEDTRLGRVKIVSITEARSSMASIMMDQSFNYIITKNNQPIRVIINHDLYQKVFSPMAHLPDSPKEPIQPEEDTLERSQKNSKQQGKKLDGLLKEREADLKQQALNHGGPFEKPSRARKVSFERKVANGFSTKTFVEETPAYEIPENEEVAFQGDFFQTPVEQESMLSPPPEQETLSESQFYQPMTQKERDYFERFKKLYSPPKESPETNTFTGQESSDSSNELRDLTPEPQQAILSQPNQSDEGNEREAPVALPAPKSARGGEPRSGGEGEAPVALPLEGATQAPLIRPYRTSSDFPSIDDLLKELEKEKLSDEEL